MSEEAEHRLVQILECPKCGYRQTSRHPLTHRCGTEMVAVPPVGIRDVVVTVPLSFGLAYWIEEGDAAGEPWSGEEWGFTTGGAAPRCGPGDRCYIVYNRRLRGYAPLIRVEREPDGRLCFVRGGGAVAVTIDREIIGFRGWRYRDWGYDEERLFPGWMVP